MKSQPYKQVNNKHVNNGPTNNNITIGLGYQKRDRSCSNLASSAMKSLLLLNDLSIEIHERYNPRKYNDNVKHVSSDILVDFRPTLCFLFIFIKTDVHVQHSIAYIKQCISRAHMYFVKSTK